MDLKIIILSEKSQTKKGYALYLYNILEHANEPIVTESRSSGCRCVGIQRGWEEAITKGHGEIFGGNGYVHYFYCCDGFMGKHMSKLIKLYTLNMCNLLYINYTSINLLFFISNKFF